MEVKTINSDATVSSKLPSKTSNTHLIKSANHQQQRIPTISSVQKTISEMNAKQNPSKNSNKIKPFKTKNQYPLQRKNP